MPFTKPPLCQKHTHACTCTVRIPNCQITCIVLMKISTTPEAFVKMFLLICWSVSTVKHTCRELLRAGCCCVVIVMDLRKIRSYERVPQAVCWLTLQCHAEAVWYITGDRKKSRWQLHRHSLLEEWNGEMRLESPLCHRGCNNNPSFLHLIRRRVWLLAGEYGLFIILWLERICLQF